MPDHYRYFGAFRLLLAVMVVVQHALPALGTGRLPVLIAPLEIGSIAVLLFFVLSGFIVTEAAMLFYVRRPGAFLTNRFIRIYPPYIVAVTLTVLVTATVTQLGGEPAVVALFNEPPDHSAANIFAALAGIFPVAGKLLAPAGAAPILILAWALRIELLFYGVVFLALWAGRVFNQPPARALGVVAIGLLLFDAQWFASLRGNGLEFTPYFVLGTSVYFAITPASARRRVLAGALVIVSSAMIAQHISGQPNSHEQAAFIRDLNGQSALFFAGCALWFFLIALPRIAPRLATSARIVDQKLGELTYPLYLSHMAALLVVLYLVPAGSLRAWPFALGACLGVAWLMHQIVETPLMVLRRRIRGPGPAMGSATVGAA